MNPAREKVELEGACRVCGAPARVCDAAHVWDRSLRATGFKDPDLIVPLCSAWKGGTGCHDDYDALRLNLEEYLRPEEVAAAVALAGSEARAIRRIRGAGGTQRPRPDEEAF